MQPPTEEISIIPEFRDGSFQQKEGAIVHRCDHNGDKEGWTRKFQCEPITEQ